MADTDYARLLALRTGLRRFERWSAQQAQAAGLTAAHHQLLLAIRGHDEPQGPTIGQVADYLLLRHHSVVGLVDRAEAAGLVRRARSDDDHRVVRLQLTTEGTACLEALSALHVEELDRLALDLPGAWAGLSPVRRPHGFPGPPNGALASANDPVSVGIARIDDGLELGPTYVLVDRLWPRGVPRRNAPIEQWSKDLAPSADLRKWYGDQHHRFFEFSRRYREELARPPADEALDALRAEARTQAVVLVTASKHLERSAAAVLKDVLAQP